MEVKAEAIEILRKRKKEKRKKEPRLTIITKKYEPEAFYSLPFYVWLGLKSRIGLWCGRPSFKEQITT